MNKIKLIAIDLDDTLLNSNSQISQENLSAIHQLKLKNVVFAPCSGRTIGEMPDSITKNPDIRYIIHSNGATILDKETGQKTYACLSADRARMVFTVLSNFQAHLTIRANGNSYIKVDSVNDYNINFYNLCPSHVNALDNYAVGITDFDEWKFSLDKIEVVSAFFHSNEELENAKEILQKNEDLLTVSVAPFNLEIMSKRAGKGNGIITLANTLGVDLENVAGVGDSGNDLPMMQAVKIRFAVSNATAQLKAVCDKVICSNDEHAVSYILNNFINE